MLIQNMQTRIYGHSASQSGTCTSIKSIRINIVIYPLFLREKLRSCKYYLSVSKQSPLKWDCMNNIAVKYAKL